MDGRAKLAMGLLIVLGIGSFLPLPGGDGEGPPGFIVALVMVFGALTLLAAFGVYRGARWAKPLGITVRSIDILTALPAYGADVPASLLVVVTVGIILSVICIVALARWQPQASTRLAGEVR